MTIFEAAEPVVGKPDFEFKRLLELPVLAEVTRAKDLPADDEKKFTELIKKIEQEIAGLN